MARKLPAKLAKRFAEAERRLEDPDVAMAFAVVAFHRFKIYDFDEEYDRVTKALKRLARPSRRTLMSNLFERVWYKKVGYITDYTMNLSAIRLRNSLYDMVFRAVPFMPTDNILVMAAMEVLRERLWRRKYAKVQEEGPGHA
jgi:hypothetical protein